MHPLQGQVGVRRRVPDMGCEQDVEEQSIPFFRLPQVCTRWCEAGHSCKGGRLSCFLYNELYICIVRVCLNFLVLLVMRSKVKTENFTTLVYNILPNVGKSVLKIKTVEK
jgi:hypothetical protein